jgi:hypothetical protein
VWHSTVTGLAPLRVMTGGVVSLTVKLVVHVAVWPAESVAVTVIVCGPRPTSVPARGLCDFVTGAHPPVVVAPAVTSGTAAWQLAFAEADWAAGHETDRVAHVWTVIVVAPVLPAWLASPG